MKYTNEDEGLGAFSMPRSGLIRNRPYWLKVTRDLLDREDQYALHIQYCGVEGYPHTCIASNRRSDNPPAMEPLFPSTLCLRTNWGYVGIQVQRHRKAIYQISLPCST